MAGDGTRFTREDAVNVAWAVVDPVLKKQRRARPYKRRSWGSKEAGARIGAGGVAGIIRKPKRRADAAPIASHAAPRT